jgi:hypothetical protein
MYTIFLYIFIIGDRCIQRMLFATTIIFSMYQHHHRVFTHIYLYTQLYLTGADNYREIAFRYRESGCDTLALFEETPWFFNVPGV